MPFGIIQAGNDLQFLGTDGTLTTLTLPGAVTLRADMPPRWAVFGRYVVLVNTPSLPVSIDAKGVVRLLAPRPPRLGPSVTDVAGGTLTGTYAGIRYTFVVKDDEGNLIAESDYSPKSGSATLATDFLKASGLDISPDEISGRRLYRPTNGGAVLFEWIDLDGNVLTEVQDDLADLALSEFAAPTLGNPPYLTHISEFRGRLFGRSDLAIDDLRYTETGLMYAWPEDNVFPIAPIGADNTGISALIGRRDALGVGRRNQLSQITGTGKEDDSDIDFDIVILSKNLGVISQESVDVFRDTGYFLWEDGVYEWGPGGITCISDGADGRGMVRSWFTTNDYFDRNQFSHAFGKVDPATLRYRLHLKNPDGDWNWVEYDLRNRTWWGPHTTSHFTPSSTFILSNASDVKRVLVGSEETDVFEDQSTRRDGTTTAIIMNALTKRFDNGDPNDSKYFGRLTIAQTPQSGGVLTAIARVGELNSTVERTQYLTLTRSDVTGGRLQTGTTVELELEQADVNRDVELHELKIEDVHSIGVRGN